MNQHLLEDLSRLLEQKIKMLKEEAESGDSVENSEEETKTLDVRGIGEGKTLTIDFENVSIKLKKLSSEYDYWIVTDSRESVQLKKGDIVQFIKANSSDSEPASIIKSGKKVKFDILRKANIDYLSNPVQSWHA